MIDLSLQNDEQEEQSQQDVPQVAEDVVKGARRDKIGTKLTFGPSGPSLSSAKQSPTLPCSLPPSLPYPPLGQHNPHLRLPSGWAQRKL